MSVNFTSKEIITGVIWKWLERSGSQLVQFIVQLVLARILLPNEYGLISIVSIFIIFAEIFVQSGFNTALIQKENADDLDFTSVFFLSLLLSLILYLILFTTAPYISIFFDDTRLTLVLRVLSLNIIIGVFNSIQNAYIARKMKFKLNFMSSIIAILISGVIGILLAIKGYGVWALVVQQLINQLAISILLFIVLDWKPRFSFSLSRVKSLFEFGSKVLSANLISRVAEQSYGLVIGKIYSGEMLAFYYRGHQFPHMIVNNVNGAINSVLLPSLSSEQNNPNRFKSIIRKAVITSGIIIFPAMMGLAAISEPLVILLLTEKWLFSVPFIQFECVYYCTIPILSANVQANRALGKSDVGLKLEILKTLLTIVSIILSIPFGIYMMMIGRVVISLVMLVISARINEKLIGYKVKDMLSDIIRPLIISIIMGIIVYSLTFLRYNSFPTIVLQILVGSIVYSGISYLTNRREIVNILKTFNILRKKNMEVN